ncbi:MAG: dTDP-4-dehydrorhamnose 3,5-epimerase family protein [bacterium]
MLLGSLRRSIVTPWPPDPDKSRGGSLSSSLDGAVIRELQFRTDSRGWLVELFRLDELETSGMLDARPLMAYLSLTQPGAVRGPHEHREQTDFFVFVGPSDFEVRLWDNRGDSRTQGLEERHVLGASRPATLVVPPGVVHGYRNIGDVDGWVFNFPNRLYRGTGRQDEVDEIRHEDLPDSPFRLENQ